MTKQSVKDYEVLFGIYSIRVRAGNEQDAIIKIRRKYDSYKDGSNKKEYLRDKIIKDIILQEVYFKNGFWQEK